MMLFSDRYQAGQELAQKLLSDLPFPLDASWLVLAIPRGGVIIGRRIAEALKIPLDIILSKKIGAPGNPELAVGAVGPIGEPALDEEMIQKLGIGKDYLEKTITEVKKEIILKEKIWREGKPLLNLKQKSVLLVDDGIATGATIQGALEVIRQAEPQKIIVAAPIIAKDALEKLEKLADQVVYLEAPELFFAVGQFYQNFKQTTDQEVKELLL